MFHYLKTLISVLGILIVTVDVSQATVLQHLTVNSNGLSGDQLVVTDGSNTDLVVKEDGRVSIGTNVSNSQLTVKTHVANSAAISVISSVGSTVAYFYESQNNGGVLYFYAPNGQSSTRISGDPSLDSYLIDSGLSIGSSIVSADLKLDVEGKAGAQQYCDNNGNHCSYPEDIATAVIGGGVGISRRFVYEGDSLSVPNQWDVRLTKYDPIFNGAEHYNVASSNRRVVEVPGLIDGLLSDYNSEAVQYKKAQDAEDVYYMVFAGVVDILNGVSALDIYNELKSVWAAAKADNFKVVAFTLHPISLINNQYHDPADEVQRILLNQYIASDPNLYDYLVRLDLTFLDPEDTNVYFSDGLHFVVNGYEMLAKEIARTISTYPHKNSTRFIAGASDVNDAVYLGNGNVGVGTGSPSAKLEVNGNIKIGDSSSTCSSSNAGEIRFDGTSFQGCDGSTWVAF